MKKVKNQFFSSLKFDSHLFGEPSYVDLIKFLALSKSENGVSHEEMRLRYKMADKIDEFSEKNQDAEKELQESCIEFEDAHANYLKQIIANHRWAVSDREILKFLDDITEDLR